MYYFLRFMGWLIVYSFLYFLSLDIMGIPPGKEHTTFQKVLNFIVIPLISVPIWYFTWKKFVAVFGPKRQSAGNNGGVQHSFALRNPALKYYLMVLKLFLLAMGANGLIALDYYEGGTRIFYICNFIVLYLYAPTFLFINVRKLKKGLATKLLVEEERLRLERSRQMIKEIPLDSKQKITVQEKDLGLLIESPQTKLYLGGPKATGSPFYLCGVEEVLAKIKNGNPMVQTTDSIKEELKRTGFRPDV